MKKTIVMATLALMSSSSVLMADYYSSNTETQQGGSYLGVAYTNFNVSEQENISVINSDLTSDMVTIIGGYNINPYVAVETRYSFSVGDTEVERTLGNINISDTVDNWDGTLSSFGFFLKPQYTFSDIGLKIYGLAGYGSVNLDGNRAYSYDISDSGFQWGGGASFTAGNFELFADYTILYDDYGMDDILENSEFLIDAWTVGVNFKF